MEILRGSLDAIRQDGSLLLQLLLCIAWGALLVFAVLKKLAGPSRADSSLAALAIAGWPIPVSFAALLLFALSLALSLGTALRVTLLLAAISTGLSLWSLWKTVSLAALWPIVLFLLMAFVRIGYVADLLLPPYFDSAWHYGLVQSLVRMQHGAPLVWPAQGYYHLGYHLILAGLSSITGGDLARLMLLFGQLTLAALPVPLFFFIQWLTGSDSAAILGLVLAGFGWSMPAHAVDWGKYPALLGLLAAEFAAGSFLIQNKGFGVLAAGLAALIHTRMLVLLAWAASAWLFSRAERRWFTVLLLFILGLEVVLLYRDPALKPVLDTYFGWAGLLALLLGILGLQRGLRPASAGLFLIVSLLAALFIPIPLYLTLLDRPLVQMMLSLPLAFLAGMGASQLNRRMALTITLVLLLYSFGTQAFSPSGCCQLAGSEDLTALGWIDRNLPHTARFVIAASDLRLTSAGIPMQAAGSDAGVWIEPLTGRQGLPLSAYTDFSRAATFRLLCQRQVTHIYAGGGERSFGLENLPEDSPQYVVIFELPPVRVLQLEGCP